MSEQKYSINEIMTIVEAAQKYGVKADTLRNKFKGSVTRKEKIQAWIDKGWVRQSGSTWLIAEEFMVTYFKNRI